MDSKKVERFMKLAGQMIPQSLEVGNEAKRALGAQLLLSEVLEYVIHGLGVVPEVNGVAIKNPDELTYRPADAPDKREMIDGLADVAYTMFWNSGAFAIPLEKAFDMVCDNNLEKFVHLPHWQEGEGQLEQSRWGCDLKVQWPAEVASVSVLLVDGQYYAVGKDKNGKVRKPSTYTSVDLSSLLA